MIPRYTRPEMAAIWDPQTRYRIWFEIEAHAADAMAELGIIPKDAAKTIWAKGKDAAFGMWPSSAMASAACASISNQMRKRVEGDQIAAMSGRE